MLLLGLLLSAHALVHPNGLIEVRIDRGSLLSGLPGLERGLRVAQAEPATGLPTATGLLLILQDASERTESDRAVLATREGSTRLDLLRRALELLAQRVDALLALRLQVLLDRHPQLLRAQRAHQRGGHISKGAAAEP